MSRIVFILGAGASAQGGCPTMNTFFRAMRQLYEHKRLRKFSGDYALIDRTRRALMQGQVKASFDIDNMERVFNALEMAEFLERLGDLSIDEIHRAKIAFINLIVAVLERTQMMQLRNDSHDAVRPSQPLFRESTTQPPLFVTGPDGYDELAKLSRYLLRPEHEHQVSVLSFNYDIGLEIGLRARDVKFRYCLGQSEECSSDVVRLYKLHGSMNWFGDANGPIDCDYDIIESAMRQEFREDVERPQGREAGRQFHFIVSDYLDKKHGALAARVPFIVPPAESKQQERLRVRSMWREAARELAEAQVICIAGYSVPDTDEFFKQLYAIGVSSSVELQRAFIIDQSGGVVSRVARIFGLPVQDRLTQLHTNFTSGLVQVYEHYEGNGRMF